MSHVEQFLNFISLASDENLYQEAAKRPDLMEKIFRTKLHEYECIDAENQLEDYFDGMSHEEILNELSEHHSGAWEELLSWLADVFEEYQDCNTAENDTWRYIIECELLARTMPSAKNSEHL